jgi:hypothetical protein
MRPGTFSVSLAVKDIDPHLQPGLEQRRSTARRVHRRTRAATQLKERGVTMLSEADESSTGPAKFMIADPDGNTILFDLHV